MTPLIFIANLSKRDGNTGATTWRIPTLVQPHELGIPSTDSSKQKKTGRIPCSLLKSPLFASLVPGKTEILSKDVKGENELDLSSNLSEGHVFSKHTHHVSISEPLPNSNGGDKSDQEDVWGDLASKGPDNLDFKDGTEACFSSDQESNSVATGLDSSEDYEIDLGSRSNVESRSATPTPADSELSAAIVISDEDSKALDHSGLIKIQKSPTKWPAAISDSEHKGQKQNVNAIVTKVDSDSDCELVNIDERKKPNRQVSADYDCRGIEGRRKRKMIDSVGALLSMIDGPNKPCGERKQASQSSDVDKKAFKGVQKRRKIDSVGSLLSRIGDHNIDVQLAERKKEFESDCLQKNRRYQEPISVHSDGHIRNINSHSKSNAPQNFIACNFEDRIEARIDISRNKTKHLCEDNSQRVVQDLRQKLNAKRKLSSDTRNNNLKPTELNKRVTWQETTSSSTCIDLTNTVVPPDPNIEDPQKLKCILSWIQTAEPSTSDLIDKEFHNSPQVHSTPKVEVCDNRRVVLATGRKFLKKPDSGYSSISTVTPSSSFAAKDKGLLWRGLADLPPLGNLSRESMSMEIDEVQNMLIEDEKMIIDDDVSMEILKSMREKCYKRPDEVVGVLTRSVSSANTATCTSQQTNPQHRDTEQNLNIVVDTNVFIHNLSFIEELKDFSIDGFGKPTLVVPWVVLQELDYLKSDRRSVNSNLRLATMNKARAPVQFLQSYLSSRHPRIVGQTPLEAKKVIGTFVIDCNDDKILQCCLQWKDKDPESLVVLLSNDVHLCSKAIVCDIKAFKKKDLFSGLAEIRLNRTVVEKQRPKISPKKRLRSVSSDKGSKSSQPEHSRSKTPSISELCDDIYCKIKLLLRDSLGQVLKIEMEKAYDDMWLQMVLRKPPWTVKDILDCFKKHWIAVFGMIYNRKLSQNVDNLVQHFSPGRVLKPNKLRELILDVIPLLDEVVRYSQKSRTHYGPQVPNALAQLRKLSSLCSDILNNSFDENNLPTVESFLRNEKQQPSQQPIKKTATSPLPNPVERKFQLVWESIQNFCLALKQLSENNHPDITQTREAFEILDKLVPILKELRNQYSLVLFVPVADLERSHQSLGSLCQQLNTFFPKLSIQDESEVINVSQLQLFISDREKRSVLMAALDHLDVMLLQLYDCVAKLPAPQENQ
ncbi:hypothetical protein ScPMuIL_010155 [Solemya velum]